MRYAIVSGTSRGLGQEVARLLIDQGVNVVGVSRSANKDLLDYQKSKTATYHHFRCDLTNADQIEAVFEKINDQIFKADTELVYLINNAATVEPIDTVCHHTVEAIHKHMDLNLIAPIITTANVLKKAKLTKTPVVVTNITSGAANRSTYGWSLYGSSKAGLNRYTETVALEEETLKNKHKIILFDPSIMDTEMQGDIRSASADQFKDVETFKDYKTDNKLRSSETVAKVLVDLILDLESLENGKQYKISDFI